MDSRFMRGTFIVGSVRQGNEFIRSLNKRNDLKNNIRSQYSADTLEHLAQEMVTEELAQEGILAPAVFYSAADESLVMQQVIEDHSGEFEKFLPENSRTAATYASLTEAVQTIRMGKLKKVFTQDDPLWKIVYYFNAECEKRADDQHSFDRVCMLRHAIAHIYKNGAPVNRDYGISAVRKETLTSLEKEFYKKYTGLPDNEKTDFPYSDGWEGKAVFIRAYGHTGEVRYTAETIINKKMNPGDCIVYYTDKTYEPVLKSIYDERKLPYSFVSGRSIYTTETGQAIHDILKWAEGGFVYADLMPVFDSKAFRVKNPLAGQEKEGRTLSLATVFAQNTGSREQGYTYTWGLDRYPDIIKDIREDAQKKKKSDDEKKDEKKKAQTDGLCNALQDLSSAFGSLNYYEAYMNLLDVLKKYDKVMAITGYDDKKPQMKSEWGLLRESLYGAADEMKLLGDAKDYEELAVTMSDVISQISVSDQAAGDRVTFIRLDGKAPDFTNRENAFFIGLSQNDVKGREAESPFFSDEKRAEYLDESAGFVATSENSMERYQRAIQSTAEQKAWNHLSICYSDFDTSQVKEEAPSVIYRLLLADSGKNDSDIKTADGGKNDNDKESAEED